MVRHDDEIVGGDRDAEQSVADGNHSQTLSMAATRRSASFQTSTRSRPPDEHEVAEVDIHGDRLGVARSRRARHHESSQVAPVVALPQRSVAQDGVEHATLRCHLDRIRPASFGKIERSNRALADVVHDQSMIDDAQDPRCDTP